MNTLIMYDRQTRSLWSHLLSEGIAGDYEGVKLINVPVRLTTWTDWKTSFPQTKALWKASRGYDPYTVYYLRGDAGVIGESNSDDRLYTKELILGVGFDDGPIAFPHTVLQEQPVINIDVNGQPVVVYYHPATNTATAYSRSVSGRILDFTLIEESDEQGAKRSWLVDDQSGSKWLPLNGLAWHGDYQGTRLESIHAVNMFWFAWSDFFPDTEIYGE